MTEPRVLVIMPTMPEREALRKRAIASFESQTYKNKLLLCSELELPTIGEKRNRMISHALNNYDREFSEIILHMDDDDWSHPERISNQVLALQSTGRDCVGFNRVLFWRETHGEAWMYRNLNSVYAVGASLCYWRRAWERHPFPSLPKAPGGTGEDTAWLRDVDSQGFNAFRGGSPQMVCSIHGGNTMPYNLEQLIADGSREWMRAKEWDDEARGWMKL